jgi:hypothetical protein
MFGKIALAHNDLATTAHGTATTNRININAKGSGGLQNRCSCGYLPLTT